LTNDPKACEYINESPEKYDCIFMTNTLEMSKKMIPKLDWYERLTFDTLQGDDCGLLDKNYQDVFINEELFPDKIPESFNPLLSDACYLINSVNDKDLCNQIQDSILKGFCFIGEGEFYMLAVNEISNVITCTLNINEISLCYNLTGQVMLIYEEIAWILYQNEMYDEAIAQFDLLIELNPDNWDVIKSKAVSHYKVGDYQEAVNKFENFLQHMPNDYDSIILLGWSYYQLESYDQALVQFNKANQLNEEAADPYIGLGWVYIMQEDYSDAEIKFQTGVDMDPSNAEAHIGLATAYLGLQQYDNTLSNLNKALDLDDKNPLVYVIFAAYYYETEDFNKAKEYIDIA
jgi:tetratricopeptide (TPR) repeat protein